MSAAAMLAHYDAPWDHGPMTALRRTVVVPDRDLPLRSIAPKDLLMESLRLLGPGSHWANPIIRLSGLARTVAAKALRELVADGLVLKVAVRHSGTNASRGICTRRGYRLP